MELQVKSKKLLISLMVVAVVIVLIVVLAAVLTVKEVRIVYHGFDGKQIAAPADGLAPDAITAAYKGKSIVFLSKSNMMAELNVTYPEWHAFAIVKHFPNVVEVHFVRRTAVAKFSSADGPIYVDCFGFVTEAPSEDNVIDISSAFQTIDVSDKTVGKELKFESEESNKRLDYVLDAIIATWQCYVEIPDMAQILGAKDVFGFDSDGSLVIRPKLHGKIVVQSPDVDLSTRLVKAFGVYYNDQLDLQNDDYTITVYKNGRITTPSK